MLPSDKERIVLSLSGDTMAKLNGHLAMVSPPKSDFRTGPRGALRAAWAAGARAPEAISYNILLYKHNNKYYIILYMPLNSIRCLYVININATISITITVNK